MPYNPDRWVQKISRHYHSFLHSHLLIMVSVAAFVKLALALPGATQAPHFEKQSFRVKNKIFATLLEKEKQAVLMLPPLNQSLFMKIDRSAIYPHPSKWGLKGATVFELTKVKKEWLQNALVEAYCGKAPKKLADEIRKKYNFNVE